MYVCMCLKVSVNYGQPVRVFVFVHKKVSKYGLEVSKSRMTAKLYDWFKSYNHFTNDFQRTQKLQANVCGGAYPEAIELNCFT